MKKLFFLVMATASFVACKKNGTDVPVTSGNSAAKIKTWSGSAIITTYTYDAQGRLVKESNSDGSGYEYEYLSGIVNENQYSAGHMLYKAYKHELNADGLVVRTTVSNDAIYEDLFEYNADKTLAKQIGHYDNGAGVSKKQGMDFFYSNGNCDSLRFTDNNGNWQTTIVKTYYTDKPNGLAKENWGDIYEGKDNKNLQKTEIYKYPDGSTNTPASYTYEFDAQGRVLKEISTQGNNIAISLLTYY